MFNAAPPPEERPCWNELKLQHLAKDAKETKGLPQQFREESNNDFPALAQKNVSHTEEKENMQVITVQQTQNVYINSGK